MRNQIIASAALTFLITTSVSAGPMRITPNGVTFSDNSTQISAVDTLIHTTGAESIFVGPDAGNLTTTGYQNTALGDNALHAITTGNRNTAIGDFSLYSNTTGEENTATGDQALWSNLSGKRNTANGTGALISNTTGEENTALGYRSLEGNSTSRANTAIGVFALGGNQTGAENTASGHSALHSNYTGSWNTVSGYNALGSNTTGNNNTAIGKDAGALTLADAPNTVSLDSIFIGSETRANDISQSNQIVIGHATKGNGSNTVTIGNTLITDNYFTGNVNVGTFSAASGLLTDSSGAISFGDENLSTAGNVGIGTANPGASLDVAGSTKLGATGTVMASVQSGTAALGSGTAGGNIFAVTFANTFSSKPNQVIVTAKNGGASAIFAVSTKNVSTTGFDVKVYRVDNGGGTWATSLSLDWLAIE